MENEHGSAQCKSKSFICPDCGLGLESIAALTVHLLTHAELNSDDRQTSSQPSGRRGQMAETARDVETLNGRTPTTGSRRNDRDDDDDDEAMDSDDCPTSINHDQSHHHHSQSTHESATDDLDPSVQGHCEGEGPTCLKLKSTTEDALEDVVLLECPYCQRKDFDSLGPLTSHIRTAHARPSDNLFTCTNCGLAFATVAKLEHHQRVEHHGDTPTSTPAAVSASSSLSGGHGSPDGGALTEPRWLCRFCPVQFYDAQTQRDHEEAIHLSRGATVGGAMTQLSSASSVVFCSQCSLGFAHIYALADHMHHSHGYNTRARPAGHDVPSRTGADTSPAGHARDPVRPTIRDFVTRDPVTREIVIRDPVKPTTRDSVTRDPVSRDPVIRDPLTKDFITRDPVTRELVIRDPVRPTIRDPVSRDPVTNDFITRDPVSRDPVRPTIGDFVTRDNISRDPVTRDPTTRVPVTRDLVFRDPVRPTAVRADSVDVPGRTTSTTTTATCAECSSTFDNDDDLESHVASAHYLSLGTEYGCTSCLKLFARPEELQKHLMEVHAHHLYRCTLCKHVFDSKVCSDLHKRSFIG